MGSKMKKSILVCIWQAFVTSILTACSVFGQHEPPPYLNKSGVHTQKIRLEKKIFAESASFGDVTDLALIQKADSVAVAGSTSAAILSKSGEIRSSVKYDAPAARVNLIPVDSEEGKFRYLNRGQWAFTSSLFDSDGKTLWTAKRGDGVDDTAYGCLSDNARGKFVIGYNGGGGVSLLDQEGKELWVKPDGNVWHVEITSPHEPNVARIVHSNAAGQITVRDGSGAVVHRAEAPFYFSNFSLCRWPHRTDDQCLLSSEQGSIWLLDLHGKVINSFSVPVTGTFGESHGTLARLDPSKPDCLATVTSWQLWNRSMLCVHTQSGELLYEEVLPERCTSILAMSDGDSKPEALLVGGSGRIWKYMISGH
jgi:hypothetical protein